MYVLDTDVLTLIQYGTGLEADRTRRQLQTCGQPDAVAVTTFQEQLRGRLAICTAAKSPEQYARATELLLKTIEDYRSREVLPFNARAAEKFHQLKALKIRIGTMDLRIASIVLAFDAILVTRNLSDFRKVPSLKLIDWTAS